MHSKSTTALEDDTVSQEMIEKFAIRLALGNNGGKWATHYNEDQKEHWRQFVRDLIKELSDGL